MKFFVKRYGFLAYMGKNICNNFPGIYSQKLLDHAKQSATDAFKTASKRAIQKTAEATCHLIGKKMANKITNIPKTSQQNDSEIGTNKHDKEIPKERYKSPEKKQKIIDDLRLIQQHNNAISKNYKFVK